MFNSLTTRGILVAITSVKELDKYAQKCGFNSCVVTDYPK